MSNKSKPRKPRPTATVYTVPRSKGERPENRFSFRVHEDGPTHSVPHLGYLSGEGVALLEQSIKERFTEATTTRRLVAIELPELADEFNRLAEDQVLAVSTAWAAATTETLAATAE